MGLIWARQNLLGIDVPREGVQVAGSGRLPLFAMEAVPSRMSAVLLDPSYFSLMSCMPHDGNLGEMMMATS
jgi:hypothetical protein